MKLKNYLKNYLKNKWKLLIKKLEENEEYLKPKKKKIVIVKSKMEIPPKTFQEWLVSFKWWKKRTTFLKIKNFFKKKINLNMIKYLSVVLQKYIKKIKIYLNNIYIYLNNEKKIFEVLYFLKYNINCQYKVLIDIFATDYLGKKKKRFELTYNLLSIKYKARCFVKIKLNEFDKIKSVTSLYKSSGWYEREIWDMFGIFFENHKDLRRILTDYGFEGYPLRKDFPQTGYIELRYDNEIKHLNYETVELSQNYRQFNFLSPWN